METKSRSIWTYVRHALVHPWHVVALALATVFGVANWSLLVLGLVFVSIEILTLAITLKIPQFRKYVDDRLLSIERAAAAEKRAHILLSMQDCHRHEILQLESCIDRTKSRLQDFPAISSMVMQECLELLAQYIKMALQYNLVIGADNSTSVYDLQQKIRSLEAAQKENPDPTNEQRIAISQRRIEVMNASYRARNDLLNQLAAISEMIHLKSEQAVIPSSSNNLPPIQFMRVDTSNIAEDLGEIASVEDIDIEMIQLGRGK